MDSNQKQLDLLQEKLTRSRNLPMLLLGAGFSLGATNDKGRNLVLGRQLTEDLYNDVLLPNISDVEDYESDRKETESVKERGDLKKFCSVLRDFGLKDKRDAYLTERMKGCKWGDDVDFDALTTYPWPYIFTLNIDDLVENVYKKNGKDLCVWTRKTPSYEEQPDKTVLIKLHGDVNEEPSYVFDDDEYQSFTADNSHLLNKFADEYVSRDLIVLGTQFQEDDLKIVLKKLIKDRCFGKNFHYFFLSPEKFGRSLNNEIEKNDNFHYVNMTNAEFLTMLRGQKMAGDSKKNLLLSNSFSDWSEEFDKAKETAKDYDLYLGKFPKASDFFYEIDIPRRIFSDAPNDNRSYLVEKIFMEEFNALRDGNKSMVVTVHGESYVGKTCLAMRLLSLCAQSGCQCFYTRYAEPRLVGKLQEYVRARTDGGRVAVCLENAAGSYLKLCDVMNNLPDNLSLTVILTALESQHQTKKYNLSGMECKIVDFRLTEKVKRSVVGDILKKLKEHNHLGDFQRGNRKDADIERLMLSQGDIVSVLWYAHHGRDFLEYFKDWYKEHSGNGQIKMFNALTFYASLGILSFRTSFLADLAEKLRIKDFSYEDFRCEFADFWSEQRGMIRLRYARLFKDTVLGAISKTDKITWLKAIMNVLSARTYERDSSEYNLMFETVSKIRHIEKYTDLNKDEILALFEDMEKQCDKLSFYWIQRCIIYSQCKKFEEASNAVSNAERVRKYPTYQMIHADARNDMARGIWYLEQHDKDSGEFYFDQGREKMRSLMDNRGKFKNAFEFSVHTFVNMSINYYNAMGIFPNAYEWGYMRDRMWDFINGAKLSDDIAEQLVGRFVKYADENDQHEDVKGMKSALGKKGHRLTDETEYDTNM